jgi:hypothetical protein
VATLALDIYCGRRIQKPVNGRVMFLGDMWGIAGSGKNARQFLRPYEMPEFLRGNFYACRNP